VLPASPWPTAPAWTVLRSRDELGGDLPLLSLSAEHGLRAREEGQGRAASDDLSGYRAVRPGDLVINRLSARDGGFAVSPLIGLVSPAYWVFRASPERVDSRWLDYVLRSAPYKAELKRISKFMPPAQFDLPWDQLRRLPVPLPPVGMQRQVADFLDAATASIDGLMRLREELDALLNEHLDAELATTISAQAEPWLPLRRVIERWIDYRGATPVKTTSGVPLVTAGNIKRGGISFDKAVEFISRDDYHDWMRRGLPQRGDVLLTTEAPLGEVAQVDDDGVALAQRVILLRPDPSVMMPRWLYWALRSHPVQASLFSMATGSTALGIKADRLRSLHVPVPTLGTQEALVSQLDVAMERREGLRPVFRRQVALLAERRQALVTAAVMGEVDVATARGVV